MLKPELAVLPIAMWTNLGDTMLGEEDQKQRISAWPFTGLPAFMYRI